ncbi:MAG: PrsW family intramembrane metalloprotease [Xanthomonadales bacterium]|nr:PrsW family intramembrane metalloprotease [Gammaproteobacteria bacterium]NND56760.1 PrsW family intramembrane metalloprotease [Xanthomonadales bacterium]NNL05362.1 PrsW family intramembrane metalloprotease [Xanthomonadales bacterium]
MLDTFLKALISLLPVIVLVIVLFRLDSHRLLGTHFMIRIFLAGCATAYVCSWINAFALQFIAIDFERYSRLIAPLVEETVKASILVYLFRTNRIGFLIDAGILGFTVGAGFSFVENIYYLHFASDAHYGVWAVRGFGTAIMHGGATALFAIVSETLTQRHLKMNPLLYLPGLIVAFLLHAIFNHFPISPVLSTTVTLLILPTILFLLFERDATTIHNFLELDFATHKRLLRQIEHGEYTGCEAGRFLKDMQDKLEAPVAAEMQEYFRLHTELVLSAESILLGREQGVDLEIGDRIKDRLQRMHALEQHIGKAGLRALRPHLQFTAKDMWEIHMLEEQATGTA